VRAYDERRLSIQSRIRPTAPEAACLTGSGFEQPQVAPGISYGSMTIRLPTSSIRFDTAGVRRRDAYEKQALEAKFMTADGFRTQVTHQQVGAFT
jgi:hypothetical protein